MSGGSRVQNRAGGPVRRATKPKAQPATGGGRGWDDVAAAKNEVFGENDSEEEKVPNNQENYNNQ